MTDETSGDLLGLKPFADAVKIATQGTVDGASAFLGRICLPAAEEFGLLLEDKVREFRTKNLIAATSTAERIVGDADVHAEPRTLSKILDEASWIDDAYLQDMWGGLLASSCTEHGDDDSNLMFLNILTNMTKAQARLLDYICGRSNIFVAENGLPWGEELKLTPAEVSEATGYDDLFRMDRELDHMRALEIIGGGFQIHEEDASVRITAIGIGLYVRCKGSRLSPKEFLDLEVKTPPDIVAMISAARGELQVGQSTHSD